MNIKRLSVEIPHGQDWQKETWTNGKNTITTIIPPKQTKEGVIYDGSASLRMAKQMLKKMD